MTDPIPHPARFSKPIIDQLRELVNLGAVIFDQHPVRILDPMAGVGTVHLLANPGHIVTKGVEIEPEWAMQHPDTIEGDATELPYSDESFEMIVTSPPYGNRMADQFVSNDGTKRMTYYHFLGRRLHENSAAGLQWGPKYQETMRQILVECKRVLVPGGLIILNVSDFIKNGSPVGVVDWYVDTLVGLQFKVTMRREVSTRRMRYGANHKLRVESESIIVFRKGVR